MFSFQVIYLTVLSRNTGTPDVPDRAPEDVHPNERTQPSAVTNENKSNWKSTLSVSAKLVLRGVRDSADAFGPLKSVAGGLCFILENCEVRPPPTCVIHNVDRCLENEGKQASDRIASAAGQWARRVTRWAGF